jgi:Uncharacterized protein conserved in bacteria (DUF2188)
MSEVVNVRFDPDSGYWIVKRDGGARASAREDTQEQGRAVGRRILARTGGELRVWNKAGNDFTSYTVGRR